MQARPCRRGDIVTDFDYNPALARQGLSILMKSEKNAFAILSNVGGHFYDDEQSVVFYLSHW